jgi:hypothetical protein
MSKPFSLTAQPHSDHLYVMAFEDDRVYPGVKIGRSQNPERRKEQLVQSLPLQLRVHRTYPGWGHLEKRVHSILRQSGDNSHGEWFQVSWQHVDAIIRRCIDESALQGTTEPGNCDNVLPGDTLASPSEVSVCSSDRHWDILIQLQSQVIQLQNQVVALTNARELDRQQLSQHQEVIRTHLRAPATALRAPPGATVSGALFGLQCQQAPTPSEPEHIQMELAVEEELMQRVFQYHTAHKGRYPKKLGDLSLMGLPGTLPQNLTIEYLNARAKKKRRLDMA